MRLFKPTVLTFLICIASVSLQAQEERTIDDGSIGDQFEFVIENSNNWNDGKGRSFEVVRRNMFMTLKAHAVDSLNNVHQKLKNTNNKVSAQQKEIDDLKAELAKTQGTLDTTNKEKDSMSLLGMQMSKSSYSFLMWSLIAGLAAFLAFFIFRFKNSNIITKAAKAKLADVENKFKEHRTNALEREQKVKRQLQDEINKQRS